MDDNEVYTVGSTLRMEWLTDYEYFSLVLHQGRFAHDIKAQQRLLFNVSGITSYEWKVNVTEMLDLSKSNSKPHLQNEVHVFEADAIIKYFMLRYWNIRGPACGLTVMLSM